MQLPLKTEKAPCFNKSLKNLKGEKWREISGTEGYFLISNYGRVKAVSRYIERSNAQVGFWTKEKILSQYCSKNRNRYKKDYTFGMVVTYQFNKKKFRPMVRRLVYKEFIQPVTKERISGKIVYNINGDGLNNYISNLAIATKSELRKIELENDRYIPPAFKVDPDKNRKHLLKMNRKKRRKVKQYRLDGKMIKPFPSLTVASLKTGISIGNISACAYRILHQTKGFVWRLESDSYNGRINDRRRTRHKGHFKKVA